MAQTHTGPAMPTPRYEHIALDRAEDRARAPRQERQAKALGRAYGRPVQTAWLFSAARTAADICVRTVRKGPAIRFQVIAADGRPSTASVYRPPGNWQSRWNTRDYLFRGRCGRRGRSRPAIFWRTGDTDQCRPWPGSQAVKLCPIQAPEAAATLAAYRHGTQSPGSHIPIPRARQIRH